MRRTLSSVLFLVALAPAPAFADAAADVADGLSSTLLYLPMLRESPAERMYGGEGPASECRAAVARGKKAGLGDDARIYSYSFSQLEDEVHFDDDRQAYLELGQISALCDEYAALRAMVPAAYAQQEALNEYDVYSQQAPKDLATDLGAQFVKQGQKCLAETDKAIAAGAPADRATKIGRLTITLTEGKTQTCQALIDFGGKLGADIKSAKDAEFDRIAAKYEKAGIKGERLTLFVENDNIDWMTKGCSTLTDVKKLAKAKKLFQWWDNADGTHTIRTYTFKGNKVKSVKDRVYDTTEAAYRGCR